MEICHVPSVFCCIVKVILLAFCFILFVTPSVFSSFQLSNRGQPHPHLNNASDEAALLGFMSAITYDPSGSLTSTWKRNVSFCQWTGIICSRRRQRVVSLIVSSMELQEYGIDGHVTTKGDVYSYGIVLLEMLTGKKPTHNMFVEGMDLQKWVGSGFPNRVMEAVDMGLLRNTSIEEDKILNCLSQLINVGLLCTKESPQGRPTMMGILGTLQSIKSTFLSAATIPKCQTDITHLLGSTSTTLNNIGEAPSSSTF